MFWKKREITIINKNRVIILKEKARGIYVHNTYIYIVSNGIDVFA